MGADARIAELKLELPPAPKPAFVYKPVLVVAGAGLCLRTRPIA